MSDTPTARDTAALVDLMWLVMRRIWDHAEERLAPYAEPQAQLGTPRP